MIILILKNNNEILDSPYQKFLKINQYKIQLYIMELKCLEIFG